MKNNKPPFGFAILCIIPFIGLITGVIIIYYGITKYKNRAFTLLGILGIIWTLLLFSLFSLNDNNKESKKQLIPLVNKNLNIIDMALSTYNNRFGEYPDSLILLNKLNINLPFLDPLQNHSLLSKKHFSYFLYTKKTNGYSLHSVGLDSEPNTSDDIYSENSR